MEAVQTKLNYTGKNLASDESFRLQSRPTTIPSGKGRDFDDFGSDLAPPRNSQKSKQPGSQLKTRRKQSTILSSGDSDEMDCLSQESRGSPDMVKPAVKSVATPEEEFVIVNGVKTSFHPDYKPKKLPNFKKLKPVDAPTPASSSSSSNSRPIAGSMRRRSPSNARRNTVAEEPVSSDTLYPFHSKNDADVDPTPRPKPRPKRKTIVSKRDPLPAPFADMVPTKVEEKVPLSPVQNKPLLRETSTQEESNSGPESRLVPKEFPSMSPLSSPPRTRKKLQPQAFPSLSLISMAKSTSTGKQKTIVDDKDEELELSLPSSKASAKPFPLNSQFFESSHTTPPSSKRSSEHDDHNRGSPRKKRKSDDPNKLTVSSLMLDEPSGINENDLLFLDSMVDPSTLCPWCDEPLPVDPTEFLVSIMESVREKSYREARPTNPLGLKASVGTYIPVCKRHRFESHQIPMARAKGWPTRIDFGKLKDRVEALRDELEALIDDEHPAASVGDCSLDNESPRSRSLFWQELLGDVKTKGTRVMASAKGQFANFDKLQPGYYGELGYIIMHQTIYQLFPPSSIDPNSVLPLTPQEFVQRILVPEAAVFLIMEDLSLDRQRAIQTLRKSVEYGVAMFPDTGEGGEAADKMVKERASARRKELEKEEALEETMLIKRPGKTPGYDPLSDSMVPSSPAAAVKKSSRPKARTKSKRKEVRAEVEEIGSPSSRDRSLPNKARKRTTPNDESDTTDASSTSCTRMQSKRGRSRAPRNKVETTPEIEVVSDHSKTTNQGRTRTNAVLSESEGSLPPSRPSRWSKRPSRDNLTEDTDNDWKSNHATPKASKLQDDYSKDLRPLDMARRRTESRDDVSRPSSSSQNLAYLMGSDE